MQQPSILTDHDVRARSGRDERVHHGGFFVGARSSQSRGCSVECLIGFRFWLLAFDFSFRAWTSWCRTAPSSTINCSNPVATAWTLCMARRFIQSRVFMFTPWPVLMFAAGRVLHDPRDAREHVFLRQLRNQRGAVALRGAGPARGQHVQAERLSGHAVRLRGVFYDYLFSCASSCNIILFLLGTCPLCKSGIFRIRPRDATVNVTCGQSSWKATRAAICSCWRWTEARFSMHTTRENRLARKGCVNWSVVWCVWFHACILGSGWRTFSHCAHS